MAFEAKTKLIVAARVHRLITDEEYTDLATKMGVADPEGVFETLAPTVGYTDQQKKKTQNAVEALKKTLGPEKQFPLPLSTSTKAKKKEKATTTSKESSISRFLRSSKK